jgi:hypothetical protein
MDDKVTVLTIKGYQKHENPLPAVGENITRKYQERIGTLFDCDARGYAIIHTARPMTGPIMQSECRIDEIVESEESLLYASEYRKVVINTTVLSTRSAYTE